VGQQLSPGRWRHKAPSSPHDSSNDILNGIKTICAKAGMAAGQIGYFPHVTTAATNTVQGSSERDRQLAVQEMAQGLVTVEAAKAYGLVIAADASGMEAARVKLSAERGATALFESSPDTLLAHCKAAIGLPAPSQPQWGSHPVAAE